MDARNDWISQYMDNVQDADLQRMLMEINKFWDNGILNDRAMLRTVDKEFRAHFGTQDSMLKTAEDAVLFEMARRYNNYLASDKDATINGWLATASKPYQVTLYERGTADVPWEFMVAATEWPQELQLAVFDDEVSAMAFVAEHGYCLSGLIKKYEEG